MKLAMYAGPPGSYRAGLPRERFSRRFFLFTLTAAANAAESGGRGTVLSSVAGRYLDPATESTVLKLTDPDFAASIPVIGNRCTGGRGFVYAATSTSGTQAYWMEVKKWTSRQLTEATALDPSSLALAPQDKALWYIDGPQLLEAGMPTGRKIREVYRLSNGWEFASAPVFSDDGSRAVFIEKNGAGYRLRVLEVARGTASTLIEGPELLTNPLPRPRAASLLFREANGGIRLIDYTGRNSRVATLAEGQTLDVQWSTAGDRLLYLNKPSDPRKLTTLREWTPETGADQIIGNTTQYVRFDANADASVFVGTSGSKASPYILLLLRRGKRELTLAEHKMSDGRLAAPVFSPNGQYVLFQSDRHGKPAIYWMDLEKLVSDPTATDLFR